MNSILRFALCVMLVTQLSSCSTASGLANGLFGTAGRMLSSMGRTVGVSDATSVKEPLQMDPHDLEKAREELQNGALPSPEHKVSTLAQAR